METILGVILGAILAGAGSILSDLYQRRQEQRAIAAAIAGEISAVLHNAEIKGLTVYFRSLPPALRGPNPPPPPWNFYDTSRDETPILRAHLDKIGKLGAPLARRVAHWYSVHSAVVLETKILASGFYNNNPHGAAAVIDRGLAMWEIAERDAQTLIADLDALS